MVLTSQLFSQKVHNNNLHDYEQKAFDLKMKFVQSAETNTYNILYHKILWEINPANRFIKGEVSSHFKSLTNNMAYIYFDLINALTVDSITQNGHKLTFTHTNNLIKISLTKTLNTGDIDSVTVFYKGIPQSLTGFGSFEIDTHNGIPVLWTLSEPYGAREWWPCKQSLTDKIDSIDIYVKTASQYKVGSNGKLIFENISGNTKLTYWKHRFPIAAYLVAIAVTNYESYSHTAQVDENNTVEILNYVYPEDKEWAQESTKYTVDVIELYSKLFIPYPFYKEKYGHAQFGWGGGMEHQTMSFMGGFSEHLIAHELAHQWFGNYVTCGSWQHIWINEGFAVFCEFLAEENLHPDNYLNWKTARLDYLLSKIQSGKIFVEDTTSVSRIFDYALTYQKGGYILQMLRTQIGDNAFFAGIKELLTNPKTSGGFAVAEDVQTYLEEAADTSLTAFFSDWYYGEGYPIYQINWNQDLNNKLEIKISQTTTDVSVPFFALRVPILLKGLTKEQLVYLHNTENNQIFNLKTDFQVNEIVFDPDLNIIAPHPAEIVLRIEDKRETDNLVSVMPNPAKEIITIKPINKVEIYELDIINAAGQQMLSKEFSKNHQKTSVNISNLPTGNYVIRISTNKGLVIKQFIKSN